MAQQVHRDDRARGTEGSQDGAGGHVPVLGVAQFVGDDAGHLGRVGALDEGVVDHDPPGRPEPRDVRVDRPGTPGRVGDQDVAHRYAVPLGEPEEPGPQRPLGHRREPVEDRLDEHREHERQQYGQPGRAQRRPDPPGRRRVGDRVEPEQRHGAEYGTDPVPLEHVDGPAAPGLGGQPVPAQDHLTPGVHRQRDQPGEEHHDQPAEDRLSRPAARDGADDPGTERGEPEDEDHDQGQRPRGVPPGS